MFRPAGCSPPNFTVTSQLQKSSDPKLNAAVVDDDNDDGPGRATERFRCENSFTSMGLVVGWCCCCCLCCRHGLATHDDEDGGHENVWFSALREREKASSLLSVSTQLFWLVMVALVLLLLLWCGGPFSEIPVRGAAERAHTRCGRFSISRRIALHTQRRARQEEQELCCSADE